MRISLRMIMTNKNVLLQKAACLATMPGPDGMVDPEKIQHQLDAINRQMEIWKKLMEPRIDASYEASEAETPVSKRPLSVLIKSI